MRGHDCLYIDTSTPFVEGESFTTWMATNLEAGVRRIASLALGIEHQPVPLVVEGDVQRLISRWRRNTPEGTHDESADKHSD